MADTNTTADQVDETQKVGREPATRRAPKEKKEPEPAKEETEEERLQREEKKRLKDEAKAKKKEEQKIRDKEKKKLKKEEKKDQPKKEAAPKEKKEGDSSDLKALKSTNFADWYSEVILRGELIEYYDISGCYILRPNAYFMWEQVQRFIDDHIKELGVSNAYFPLFVTKKALETEKDHVQGFSPEVAWVTKSGDSELAEHIAVRPTSETIMYPAYAKWIRSHRDLPLRLNQWTNVVRWEFKSAVPFIRSREFLWQEGHSAFATLQEAEVEVYQILDMYSRAYEEILAVPVVKGKKSEGEKFAGGYYTTSIEGFIPTNGKAVQAATSHCLGQNFSKMFGIEFETEEEGNKKEKVWQNSWGFTTRSLGVMIMVHGDDKGLVLPPRAAPVQAVIVPLFFKDTDKEALKQKAKEIFNQLKEKKIRVVLDDREYKTPRFKFVEWEIKGVPLRIEIGPKDLAANKCVAIRRNDGQKKELSMDDLSSSVHAELESIQNDMFQKAKKQRDESIINVTEWSQFVPALNQKKMCLAPWCEVVACEENIKKKSHQEGEEIASKSTNTAEEQKEATAAAKSLCIPLEQQPLPEDAKCFCCGQKATKWTLFGRSY
ncbi:prolyl tRS [Acrasis kona]|uniref:proline--tRNA ligase n=1 Tax=Acrasis kona TaxID=1008807 RepID=A0AAW2Z315_9EUKA